MRKFENVFVLNTGRCGSTTFIRACEHLTNFSASHESRTSMLQNERMNYPTGHIEADNRLSWLLGRLDESFGNRALYVYLRRDRQKIVNSFARRQGGIIDAYVGDGIMMGCKEADKHKIASDYVETIDSNIRRFLHDKTNVYEFFLEHAADQFPEFVNLVGGEGNILAAVKEFETTHNSSSVQKVNEVSRYRQILRKIRRKVRQL